MVLLDDKVLKDLKDGLDLHTLELRSFKEEYSKNHAEFQTSHGAKQGELGVRLTSLETKISTLEKMAADADKMKLGIPLGDGADKKKFSLGRAFKIAIHKGLPPKNNVDYEACKLEFEAFNALKDMPDQHWVQKAQSGATAGQGGYLIPLDVYQQIIPELLPATISAKLGITILPGLTGDLTINREGAGITASYFDAPKQATITKTEQVFMNLKLSPHYLAGMVDYTFDMAKQPAIAMEPHIRKKLIERINLKRDLVAFRGDPGLGTNEPRGVVATDGINTIDWSGAVYTGATQTVSDKLRLMVKKLATSNALATAMKLGWAAHTDALYKIGLTKDGQGLDIFMGLDEAVMQKLMGYMAFESTQLDSGTAADQTLIFGDWAQLYETTWGTLELLASDTAGTNLSTGTTSVRAVFAHDMGVVQPTAFCVAQNFNAA